VGQKAGALFWLPGVERLARLREAGSRLRTQDLRRRLGAVDAVMLAQKQPPTPSTTSKQDGRSRDAWEVEREHDLPMEVMSLQVSRAFLGESCERARPRWQEADETLPCVSVQPRQNLSGVPHLSLLSLEQVRTVTAHSVSCRSCTDSPLLTTRLSSLRGVPFSHRATCRSRCHRRRRVGV
jgi:hypothetical protein